MFRSSVLASSLRSSACGILSKHICRIVFTGTLDILSACSLSVTPASSSLARVRSLASVTGSQREGLQASSSSRSPQSNRRRFISWHLVHGLKHRILRDRVCSVFFHPPKADFPVCSRVSRVASGSPEGYRGFIACRIHSRSISLPSQRSALQRSFFQLLQLRSS